MCCYCVLCKLCTFVAYWRYALTWIHPKYIGMAPLIQIIMASSFMFYCMQYPNLSELWSCSLCNVMRSSNSSTPVSTLWCTDKLARNKHSMAVILCFIYHCRPNSDLCKSAFIMMSSLDEVLTVIQGTIVRNI